MQPLLSWAESKIFGGLHIVLCGWILFTPRRMMWVMLLCFLLSPSILKRQGQKTQGGRKRSIATLTIKDWTGKPSSNDCFFAGLHPFQFPKQPLSDSQAVDGAAHLIRQERREHQAPGDEQTWSAGDLAGWNKWPCWNPWNVKFWHILTIFDPCSYHLISWHPMAPMLMAGPKLVAQCCSLLRLKKRKCWDATRLIALMPGKIREHTEITSCWKHHFVQRFMRNDHEMTCLGNILTLILDTVR